MSEGIDYYSIIAGDTQEISPLNSVSVSYEYNRLRVVFKGFKSILSYGYLYNISSCYVPLNPNLVCFDFQSEKSGLYITYFLTKGNLIFVIV